MKSTLITGANKGIGLETAKQLSEKGFFVYIGSRNIEKGYEAVKELNDKGLRNIRAVELDVTNPETILATKSIIEQEQGRLDILINNAGISGGFVQTALSATTDQFKEVFDTNLFGVVRVTQAFIDLLKKSDEPRIVNVSTSMGSHTLRSDPASADYFPFAVYQSSKSALNMYTLDLAYELRNTNFKVNAVCPGYTKTDFTNHQGNSGVDVAAGRIIKYALIGNEGPTGGYFCEELFPETGECPW